MSSSPKVILNTPNPGLCHSELSRDVKGIQRVIVDGFLAILARTTEVGSRNFIAAAAAGDESHGQYISECVVTEPSKFVRSEEGKKIQEKVYKELLGVLETIQPGISANI